MSNGRGRHQKKIEAVHWTFGSFSALAFGPGTIGVGVTSAQHLPETLLRIRGQWVTLITTVIGTGVLARITCGLILVPEGTGTSVLWSPETDGDAPWIWWDAAFVGNEESVTDVIGVQAVMGVQKVIDSKAMRRNRNMELQFVAENVTVNATTSVDIAGAVRILSGS